MQVTSGREGHSTYNSLPVLTAALSYQSSSTTAASYLIARRIASLFRLMDAVPGAPHGRLRLLEESRFLFL